MITALRDDVIIKPIEPKKTESIIIPEAAGSYKQTVLNCMGEVVSVGSKFKMTFTGEPLRPRDKIIYTRNEGKLFIVNREKYIKLRSRWVLAKIT